MPRKPLIRTSRFSYHITTRVHNREWFPLPLPKVWQRCLESMTLANDKHPIELISFVLMSNHYHMMLKTPDENLDLFMYEFNKNFSAKIRSDSQRINQVFGGRYKWCLILSRQYSFNCYRYVYQNPLRAGLVDRCENYPFSTLHHIHHSKDFPLQLHDPYGFKDEYGLNWLNERITDEEAKAVRNGLRKRELITLKDRVTRRLV